MSDPILAELELERFGDLRELKRERLAIPLSLRTDAPRNWLQRRQVLLDCLESIPQDYRQGRRSSGGARQTHPPRVLECPTSPAQPDEEDLREAA